jgi:hypothetical protein
VRMVAGILKFSDETELCIAFVNQTGISGSRYCELIAAIHTYEVSLKLWISMANVQFPCRRLVVDWQKHYKI